MHATLVLSLIAGVSSLALPRSTCSFGLTASGGESGTIGQLSDGQNRIGGGLSAATFTISNGGIIDAAGRGCILTPSVKQFQCDQGVGPTFGFSIDSNQTLTYSGSSIFYACPASETEWNLYTTPVIGQKKCTEITLTASGCSTATTAPEVVTVTVYDCTLASSALAATTLSESIATHTAELTTSSPAAESATALASEATIISTASPSVIIIQSTTETAETTSQATTSLAISVTESSVLVSTIPVGQSSTTVEQTTSSQTSETSSTSAITFTSLSTSSSVETSTITTSPTAAISPSTTPIIESTTSLVQTTLITSITTPTYSNTTSSTSTFVQSATSSSIVSTTQSSSTCVPTILTGSSTSGNYQYPHLIIPVTSSSPDTAAGTQYFGTISSNTSTIFNFDIPSSYSGSTCSLIFLLPLQSELETSSYTFSGTGVVDFERLSSAATETTTWDNAPSVSSDLGTFTLTEGSSTLIQSVSCAAGETVTYEMSAVGDTYLHYFQDWNPSPLGLFITYC